MAFSFGTSTPAPAFGAPAAAPAGGLFGAPAPAPSGGLFGAAAPAAPAPAGGLFGAAPAPAAGGLFGSAPAPSGGLFGSAPAPSGGLFGSTPAPTSAGGLFGGTTPAPAGGLFGSAPAPSGGLFGSTTPAPAFGAQPQQQQYVAPLSGSTPYSQLPPNLKNAIDDIYRQMMSHRRTLATVKTMAPSLLEDSTQTEQASQPTGADAAAGSPSKRSKNSNFAQQLTELHRDIEQIAKDYQENINNSSALKSSAGEVVAMAKLHGLWPIETIATRRQVILSSLRQRVEGASASASNDQSNLTSMPEMDVLALQHIMDMRAASVDRKEQIPSPYYWEVLRDLEKRANTVSSTMEGISHRLIHAEEAERNGSSSVECNPSMILCDNTTSFPAKCAKLARIQNDQFLSIAHGASRIHEEVEILKARHRRLVEQRGTYYDDPFFKADVEEMRKEREIQQRIIEERLLANKDTAPVAPGPVAAAPAAGGGLFGNAPAPASGGLFGSAPAPSGGLFGSSTTATVPSTGGLFGTPAAAPTPSGGGLFGSTPAPAPAGGGLFGTPAPAPNTGGLFGSTTPAPAPTGGGLFGAPAPAAPAPATGGLFGAAPAAPAPAGGLFSVAPTTPASTLAPRKKPGSRSGGRRR